MSRRYPTTTNERSLEDIIRGLPTPYQTLFGEPACCPRSSMIFHLRIRSSTKTHTNIHHNPNNLQPPAVLYLEPKSAHIFNPNHHRILRLWRHIPGRAMCQRQLRLKTLEEELVEQIPPLASLARWGRLRTKRIRRVWSRWHVHTWDIDVTGPPDEHRWINSSSTIIAHTSLLNA